jgi:hypothetical protein
MSVDADGKIPDLIRTGKVTGWLASRAAAYLHWVASWVRVVAGAPKPLVLQGSQLCQLRLSLARSPAAVRA